MDAPMAPPAPPPLSAPAAPPSCPWYPPLDSPPWAPSYYYPHGHHASVSSLASPPPMPLPVPLSPPCTTAAAGFSATYGITGDAVGCGLQAQAMQVRQMK